MTGPGSQPSEMDGAELDILQLPSGMDTYKPPTIPEPEDVSHLRKAIDLLHEIQQRAGHWSGENIKFNLHDLTPEEVQLVDQVLGEGEVSIVFKAQIDVRIQESVLTGFWRVKYFDHKGNSLADTIQAGRIPDLVELATFTNAKAELISPPSPQPEGVCNALPLISEINEKLKQGSNAHTINLTLLPQTQQDLDFLELQLGPGGTTILSRGYGNCRISSTNTHNVWWVRYFNSQDKNILNTLEICPVPQAACAAAEDIADSATRLQEILDIYQ